MSQSENSAKDGEGVSTPISFHQFAIGDRVMVHDYPAKDWNGPAVVRGFRKGGERVLVEPVHPAPTLVKLFRKRLDAGYKVTGAFDPAYVQPA